MFQPYGFKIYILPQFYQHIVPMRNVIKLRAVGSISYYNNGFKSVDEHAKFWARAVGSVHINFIQALKCVEPTALIPSSRIFQRIKIRCYYIS